MITSSIIITYIFLGVWSIYAMGWKWWKEIVPVIDTQRVARIALSTIVEGAADTTAGQETIGSVTYKRRSGISWITRNGAGLPATPIISADGTQISFMLEGDAANSRKFYIGQDTVTGMKALYYADNSGASREIKSTQIDPTYGDIKLTFLLDTAYQNLIKVTVRVEKRVPSTIYATSPIVIEYSGYVYIRNV